MYLYVFVYSEPILIRIFSGVPLDEDTSITNNGVHVVTGMSQAKERRAEEEGTDEIVTSGYRAVAPNTDP